MPPRSGSQHSTIRCADRRPLEPIIPNRSSIYTLRVRCGSRAPPTVRYALNVPHRQLLAGTRPSNPAVATGVTRLDLGLLGDFQGIVNLNAEIPDGALELRVPEQQLHGSEISGPSVDQRCFRAPQRMRPVCGWVETDTLNPRPDNPGILSSRKVRRLRHATRKKELLWLQMRRSDPGCDRVPRLLSDLKLDRPLGLFLHDNREGGDPSFVAHIVAHVA